MIESMMSNHLIRATSIASGQPNLFQPKDFLSQILSVENVEYIHTHEFKILNYQKQLSDAQDKFLQEFIAPNFSKHVCLRCKHNLYKSQFCKLVLGQDQSQSDSKQDHQFNDEVEAGIMEEIPQSKGSKRIQRWTIEETSIQQQYEVELMEVR